MTRLAVLRAGYGAFALAFVALAGLVVSGNLVLVMLAVAFVGALLLVFSDDDLPKWAGLALLAYFTVTLVAFLLATPITVRRGGGGFGVLPPNPELASLVFYYLGALSPLIFAGTALAAAWEREQPARLLLIAALSGLVVVGLLTLALSGATGVDASSVGRATAQGNLLRVLLGLSAVAGAVGAGWAAARPDELG